MGNTLLEMNFLEYGLGWELVHGTASGYDGVRDGTGSDGFGCMHIYIRWDIYIETKETTHRGNIEPKTPNKRPESEKMKNTILWKKRHLLVMDPAHFRG